MRTFSKGYGVCLALAAAVSSGCLRKDVTHTLYLAPAGVTWSAIERDVRSDDPDPAVRLREEQDYLLAVRAGRHRLALALGSIGATRVTTSLLRSDRPFTAMTEGHFADLGELVRAALRRAGMRGDATVERDGCRRTFRAWIDVEQEPQGTADDIAELLGEADAYRIVLTEGRFLNARGFTIVEDETVAVPVDETPAVAGIVNISLAWSEGWCNGAR